MNDIDGISLVAALAAIGSVLLVLIEVNQTKRIARAELLVALHESFQKFGRIHRALFEKKT